MAQHSGQGRLGHINHGHGGHSHGGHGVNGGHSHGRHGQMMMQPHQPHQPPHQYSQAQGPVIVTMGGGHMGGHQGGQHMSPGAQGHMSQGGHHSVHTHMAGPH